MLIKSFLILVCLYVGAYSIRPCCSNNNIMTDHGCLDKSKINLNCTTKVKLDPMDTSLTIDNSDYLYFEGELIATDEYCTSYKGDNGSSHNYATSPVYVVCYKELGLEDNQYIRLFFTILGFISVFFLMFTIAVYLFLPPLMDLQGICIVESICGLALSYFLLGINQVSEITSRGACLSIGSITYVALLYAFFWLNLLTFHIWRTTVKPNLLSAIDRWWLLVYHVYGIVGPLAFLIFLMVGHFGGSKSLASPGFGEGVCWFKSLDVQFVYLYGPIAALICINIFFYLWTVLHLWREITTASATKKTILIYRIKLCLKLFIIMGLTWMFEIFSVTFTHRSLHALWLVTDTINAMEGTLVFLVLVVFRKKTIRLLANKKPFSNFVPSQWKALRDEEYSDAHENDQEVL